MTVIRFGIPVHAFRNGDGGPYAVTVGAETPGPVPVEGAPALLVEHGLDALARADTVVVPGQARPGRSPSTCWHAGRACPGAR